MMRNKSYSRLEMPSSLSAVTSVEDSARSPASSMVAKICLMAHDWPEKLPVKIMPPPPPPKTFLPIVSCEKGILNATEPRRFLSRQTTHCLNDDAGPEQCRRSAHPGCERAHTEGCQIELDVPLQQLQACHAQVIGSGMNVAVVREHRRHKRES